MSDYTGPGVYQLIPGNAPNSVVSALAAGTTSGTAVQLWSTGQTENLLWEIVAAGGDKGDPETGDRQYHILALQSGLMLCAKEDGTDAACTISTRNVRHGSSRWKIIPAKNGLYYFANVLNTDKWLAVTGAATANGTNLMTYQKTEASHFQFKLKKPNY